MEAKMTEWEMRLAKLNDDVNDHQAIFEQRYAELASTLMRVEKERDDLSEERRQLQRSNVRIQELYDERDTEKSVLKDELRDLQIQLSQAQTDNISTNDRLKNSLSDMERLHEEL